MASCFVFANDTKYLLIYVNKIRGRGEQWFQAA